LSITRLNEQSRKGEKILPQVAPKTCAGLGRFLRRFVFVSAQVFLLPSKANKNPSNSAKTKQLQAAFKKKNISHQHYIIIDSSTNKILYTDRAR